MFNFNDFTSAELQQFIKEAQAEAESRNLREFEEDKKKLIETMREFTKKYPTAEWNISVTLLTDEGECYDQDFDFFCHVIGYSPEHLADEITF